MTDTTSQMSLWRLMRFSPQRRKDNDFSYFEYWPGWLFYFPIVLQWIALGFKHRRMTTPTLANPLIETGGLCGEAKTGVLDQMIPGERDIIAKYTSFRTGNLDEDLPLARQKMVECDLTFPLVVKPDVSCNGTGVKVVANEKELDCYLRRFPRNTSVILQRLVKDEFEAGVFYMRRPGDPSGRITSLTLKHSPCVTGDGRSTLRQLITSDRRAEKIKHLYFARLSHELSRVPRDGEKVRLVFVGNHCKGAIFRNGNAEITQAMTARFDEIAKSIPEFYFGRFDVKYSSLQKFRAGEGFSLIEINGVGSEATHIWDKDTTLTEAYRTLFFHQKMAFEIGHLNRKRGFKGISLRELGRFWRRQVNLMASYPAGD